MLVPVVFLLALLATLATAMLETGASAARISLQSATARYSDAAVSDAVADFTGGLAAFVARNGSRGPWPRATSRSYPRSLCGENAPAAAQCPFSFTVAATITAASSDAAPAGEAAGTVVNLQTSVIDEARVSAEIAATLTARDGTVMGTRTRTVTYRVFAAPPYAVVAGVRDADAAPGPAAVAEGDDGGAPGAHPALSGDSGDTRIHVQLTCATVIADVVPFANDAQPNGNDGLPWGAHAGGAYETPCHAPAAAADAFANARWNNGNRNSSGWSR